MPRTSAKPKAPQKPDIQARREKSENAMPSSGASAISVRATSRLRLVTAPATRMLETMAESRHTRQPASTQPAPALIRKPLQSGPTAIPKLHAIV